MRREYGNLYEKMDEEVSWILYDKVQEIFIEMQNKYIPDLTDGDGGYECELSDAENELTDIIMKCLNYQYRHTYDRDLEEASVIDPEFEKENWGF